MFKKILIVYSEKLSNKHLETIEKVKKIFEGKDAIIKSMELSKEDFADVDLVITIGGDGAFIRAARFIEGSFIIGINSEPETSEGELTSIKEDELGFLNKVLEGDFNTKELDRIQIKINDKLIENCALNEVYFGSSSQFHTSRYIIKFNNNEEEQRSSGVLIATSSGSKAWYRSAGGKLFKEKVLKFLVRELYFGERLYKPRIIQGTIDIGGMEFINKRYNGGIIAIDSNLVYNLNFNDKVGLSLSNKPLRVIVKYTKP